MIRGNILSRISRLEGAVMPPSPNQVHTMIGDSAEECEVQRRALIDSGKAKESDLFIFRIIVSPEPRTYTLSLRAQEGDPANETH
jgi:hypothetical protein